MRLAALLSATALALVAVTAAAQDNGSASGNGLAGLSDTLNGLSDEDANAAQSEAPPAAENMVAEPAVEAQPEPQLETQQVPVAEPGQEPAPTPPPPPPPPASTRPARAPLVMPPEPLTRAQLTELQAASTRGRLLGAIERAGRLATQDMLARVPDPDGAGISGWLAEGEGNGVVVTFYADTDAGPVSVFRVTINGGRVVDRDVHLAGIRPPLNPIQARMAAARAASGRLDNRPCAGDTFNVFVVPPLTPDGAIDVYQVSPQTRPGFYPFGGHFRSSFAPDGSLVATRGYDACIDQAVAIPAPGTVPAPIAVAHPTDPLPQDIHAFLSVWTGHPLTVQAGEPPRAFAVTPSGIAEVARQGAGR